MVTRLNSTSSSSSSSSRLNTSQSLEDKLYALKYFLSGKGIPFVVVKATTSELIGPKKKHLIYLVNMTHEPNVSIPNMVKHLMIRARFPDWSVAFKSIITIHYLMTYGNEKFIQNLASSTVNNRSFDRLCSYADRTTTLGYNMSVFLRRYSRYINNKIQTYRSLGMDFCRINQQAQQLKQSQQQQQQLKQTRASSSSSTSTLDNYYYHYTQPANLTTTASYYVCQDDSHELRHQNPTLQLKTMPSEQLLKVIPIIQNQFDSLLAFDASADDLCNGIINSAFTMLYKDFVKLYIVYQVAIIRLLELYFSNNILKKARDMLELYKKFLVRMDKVSDFMPVVDMVGMDKSDLPNLSRAPNLPLKMLEKHIEQLSEIKYAYLKQTNIKTPNAMNNNNTNKFTRMQSVELPRIEYGTLGRPRKRSLRTPTSLIKQRSIDFLSPMTAISHKRRQQNEEIKRLDRMLEIEQTPNGNETTTNQCESQQVVNNIGQQYKKKKRSFDQSEKLERVGKDDELYLEHRYEDLIDSLISNETFSDKETTTLKVAAAAAQKPLKPEKQSGQQQDEQTNSTATTTTTITQNIGLENENLAKTNLESGKVDLFGNSEVLDENEELLDFGVVTESNQRDLLILQD